MKTSKPFTLLLLCCWLSQLAFGQKISGVVLDKATRQPVIGATVVASDNQGQGTTTDEKGGFSLALPSGSDSIRVSYIGYQTQTLGIGTATYYTIELQPAEHSLNQLVVVGYGTQKKADLTGAVSTVDVEKTFISKPLNSPDKALQGVVPGLTITYGNGGLTAAAGINIRGIGSLNGSSRPLILVDNVETDDLSYINPNDIESVSVLKDAASASIYGTRAAFGVVLIKTKSGTKNRPTRVSYSNNFSWNTPTVLPDFADPVKELDAMYNASVRSGNTTPDIFGMELPKLRDGIANWKAKYANNRKGNEMVKGEDFDVIDGVAYFYRVWDVKKLMLKKFTPQQMQNIQVSGGSEKIGYYLSVGYNHQGGIMKIHPDDVKQYNVTSSVSATVNKWLDVDMKMLYRNFDYTEPYQYQTYWYYMWRWGAYWPYGTYDGYYFKNVPAYLAGAKNTTVKDEFARINLGATANIAKGLSIRAVYTIDRDNVIRHNVGGPITAWDFWSRNLPLHNIASASQDETDYQSGRYLINSFNAYATYNKALGSGHHLKFMAGINAEDDEDLNFTATHQTLLDPNKGEIPLATGDYSASGSHAEDAYAGYFGRINYDYKEKYLLEVNGRYDGSSSFPPSYRWAFFPSVSAGWRIGEESFMAPLKPFLDDWKFRISYGTIGNQDVGGKYYIPSMGLLKNTDVNWMDGDNYAIAIGSPLAVAKLLKWERVRTLDAGTDISLMKNNLSVSFDWFQRTTDGMLSSNAVASTFGAAAPKTNNGSMRDRGWELTVYANYPLKPDWQIYGVLNFSDSKAVVTQWNNPSKIISDHYAGETYGDIWGFETDRYFTEQDDMSKLPDQSKLATGNFKYGPGDIKYKDLDGNNVIDGGKSTADDHGDLRVIGNTQPRYLYSLRLGSVLKNFDLDIFLQGVGKRSLWGVGDMVIPMYRGGTDILYANQLDFWTPDHPNAKYPNPSVGSQSGNVSGLAKGGNNFYPQTKYLMNLAYCRLKNITFGYTLPQPLLQKYGIQNFRIYVSGENLAEISNVGVPLDPEITDGESGFTGRTFPFQRNYSFGVQLTF